VQIGKEILLRQLELMEGDGFDLEIDYLPEINRKECIALTKAMEIPEFLKAAFSAYYLEYVVEKNSIFHDRSVFFNEDDLNVGIYNKLYYYYWPIVNCAEKKINIETEIKIETVLLIEPSCQYCSSIAVIVLQAKKEPLIVPFVAYMDNFRIWWPFFGSDSKKLPQNIYQKNESIMKIIVNNTKKGLLLNGIDLPKQEKFQINKWAKAIAERLSDEWDGKSEFPEDAKLIKEVIEKALIAVPDECAKLVGTRIIEESYFDPLN